MIDFGSVVVYLFSFLILSFGFGYLLVSIKKLWTSYHSDIISKRKPSVLFGILILYGLYICIVSPIQSVLDIFEQNNIESYIIDLMWDISQNLSFPIFIGLFMLYIMRVYLLNYDHQYHNILLNKEWMVLINPNEMNNNYYVKYRNTLGNPVWLMKYIGLPVFIVISILYGLIVNFTSLSVHSVQFILFPTLAFIGSIVMGYFWIRIPNEMDTIGIRIELRLTCLWLICGQIFVVIPIFSIIVFQFKHGLLLTLQGVSILCYVCIYLMVYFPHNECLKDNQQHKLYEYLCMICGNKNNKKMVAKMNQNTTNYITWKEYIASMFIFRYADYILKTFSYLKYIYTIEVESGFHGFMRHLTLEFSSENLLFIVECKQLCNLLDIDMPALKNIHLPKEIPLSSIVKNLANYKSNYTTSNTIPEALFYDSCKKIYLKYIRPGSSLCININYDTRLACTEVFEKIISEFALSKHNEQVITFVSIFNKILRQTNNLLYDSFYRYASSYKVLNQIQQLKT